MIISRKEYFKGKKSLFRGKKALNCCASDSGGQRGYRVMRARCQEKGVSIRKEDVGIIQSTVDHTKTYLEET